MKKLIVLLILLFAVVGGYFLEVPETLNTEYYKTVRNEEALQNMNIYIPELENGRCVIIKMPTGEWALVDCGNSADFPAVYEKLRELNVKIIDFVVFTSTEKSSLGGLEKILGNFKVSRIFCSVDAKNSSVCTGLIRSASGNNVKISYVAEGSRIYDFDRMCIDVVSNEKYFLGSEVNAVSLYIIFGNRGVFLEGECDITVEAKMAAELRNSIKSDVLIVPYGKRMSERSRYFAQEISPQYTVVNVYESSSPKANHLEPFEISEVYRTDDNGDISFVINEENIKLKIER